MEGSKILTIKPHEFNFDKEGYDHTKVLGLKCYIEENMKVTRVQPKTWASLVREVIHVYNYEIGLEVEYSPNRFEEKFNNALKEMLKSWGGKANSNFTDKLFTQPTHLKSSVYMNNQNSMLEIFHNPETEESKYITAVYSGEVVWILNALITALEEYGAWIEIEYIHRDELRKQLGELEEMDRQLSIDDIPQETPEQDKETTEIQGTAELYIAEIKLKLIELYQRDIISHEDYEQLRSWTDKLAVTIIDAKAFMTLFTKFSKDLGDKLGV